MMTLEMLSVGFLPNLGVPELVIIFLMILLLFGAKRLPGLFRSFGQSLGEFKRATRDIENDFRDAMESAENESPKQPAAKKPESTQAHSTPESNKAS